MAKAKQVEAVEVGADAPAEQAEVAKQVEAVEQVELGELLEFEVLTNRMFGYEVGDNFTCYEAEFQPQWAQHLKQI